MFISINGFRKYFISALYIGLFVVLRLFLHLHALWVIGAYLLLTATLAVVYYPTLQGLVGSYYFSKQDFIKAEPRLKNAIDKNCKNASVYLNYAIILVQRGDAAEALRYLETANRLSPSTLTHKNILLTMSSCHWVMNDPDQAITILEDLIRQDEVLSRHAFTTLGYLYFAKGDYAQATHYTQLALANFPESGAAWDNMGQIHYKQNALTAAKEAFLKAIEYKKDLADSHYYLGLIAEAELCEAEAAQYFSQAYHCNISFLNTVTREQLDNKYAIYSNSTKH